VAARPRQPCAWVRCAKGSWRACGVSAAVSDQAWREAAQSFIGNRACMHGRMQVKMRGGQSLSLCVPCAAVDVAQMPDAPPRGGRGKFTSQLVE
jgi:hypothetical protein